MNEPKPRVMLVGHFETGSLECSYMVAFESLGCKVLGFDIIAAENRYVRLGLAGQMFSRYVPVEPWIQKAHREFALQAMDWKPDLILTFGQRLLRVGSLAQIRSSTEAWLVHVWSDPFFNWNTHLTACISMYDCVATYSQATVPVFQRLGARHALWLPLAGDPLLHPVATCTWPERQEFGADICFIGGWRPEREATLSRLGDFDMKIWGPEWDRRCRGNKVIMNAWQKRAIFGLDFSKAVACSKINLDIIDPTNYPAANMRFFEISTAGGLQISSTCPEMEQEFRHGEHIFYYRQMDELPDLVRRLLADDELRSLVSASGHQKVLADHTYVHRARHILQTHQSLEGNA